ncbi:hypothetical protein DFR49_4063 [Hephaestia caeni]|jgi:hypothetical protein|uniref:Uncharacterized protein n=2 Tax=Alphaproteobacteria TaxID=28211 RepID=A0A397NSW0_9SPHN|nr:hypothetical protein Xaut_2854 [Xanthobacter autotrophicus Py2]KOX56250.1 hypothetical protein ADL19_11320 [Streptomyces purpurogeneiscleroticus]ODT53603.1 MAG: hypothetical protein ABS59_07050 [Methylobacterium sp. SCN 67-24]RIA36774.1 hypothetical protein DFR49_4063 [Hephaestia caeni]
MAQKRRVRRVLPEWSGESEDLYDYARPPAPRAGRSPLRLEGAITVTDDWPEIVPITDAELRVMESHFAQELDELFGPRA